MKTVRIDQLKRPLTKREIEYLEKNIHDFLENHAPDIDSSENLLSLLSGNFEKEKFYHFKSYVFQLWRNNKTKKALLLSVKLIFQLIEIGENNDMGTDYEMEKELSRLYDALGLTVMDYPGIKIVPMLGRKPIIEKDNEQAKIFHEKAFLLDPDDEEISFNLGWYYYKKCNYHKAYYYWINNSILIDEKRDDLFNELGIALEEEYKKRINYIAMSADSKAFACYEKAYLIGSIENDSYYTPNCKAESIYNIAYAYLRGVGTKKNTRKGKQYLSELADYLSASGQDITSHNDPDGIIKEFYLQK